MARIEKAIGALIVFAALASAQNFQYRARHDHLRKGGIGVLKITPGGVAFTEDKHHKHPHAWKWGWDEIQQLTVAPRRITVLTYRDDPWRLGADRQYRFDLREGGSFAGAYRILKGRLDQRLVAELSDPAGAVLWRIPAKHLLRFGGEQGTLVARPDGLSFETAGKDESRTWRWKDIENVSTSGPFQLTVTTFERSRAHYGSLKGFNFQLKSPLGGARYDDLWTRVNASKDLPILQTERNEKR